MKKVYSTIFLAVLFSFSISAQVIEDELGEFLIIEDDFLIGIGDNNSLCCNNEVGDLSFRFSISSALLNHNLIKLAEEQALEAWFYRQKNIMKNEIENRFDKNYSNFKQARNDYFKNWEKQNILSIAGSVKNKYDSRVRAGRAAREGFARNLKLLELREAELNLGNINNTNYGAFNFNDVPIGNITSLGQLNTLRNQEMIKFSSNEVSINHNSGVSLFLLDDIIKDMGSYSNRFNFNYNILDNLLPLQINHYNTIGRGLEWHKSWYQLDLMQMYLNNIRIRIPYISPDVFPRYFGSARFLETYANQHRKGGISIWDDGYEQYLVDLMLHPNETDERAIEAAEYAAELQAEGDRQEYLNNLLGNISEVDLLIEANRTYFSKKSDDPEAVPIELNEIINCFETTGNENGYHDITIYVDQPIANSDRINSGADAGHTFIRITQSINGSVTTKYIGFYPEEDNVSPNNPTVIGGFYDDSGHSYDVSLTVELTPDQFNSLIQYLDDISPEADYTEYDLNEFNCSDFGLNAINLSGVGIPDSIGEWGGEYGYDIGQGTCPALLGQDIRNNDFGSSVQKDTNGGNAGNSTQNVCN